MTETRTTSPSTTTTAPARRKDLVAATFGNFLEHYDFVLFAVFAPIISTSFFPSDDPAAALLNTFAIYGVAFIGRPLGAALFGRYGDRAGRRKSLSAAVLLMVVATVVIGVTPSYGQIGVWAAVILFVARFVQGLSAGGEMAGAGSYLIEMAPPRRRALFASWQSTSSSIGQVAASGLGVLLVALLTEPDLNSWGWRLAFLIAAPLGVIGLYMRLNLMETPRFQSVVAKNEVVKAPIAEILKHHRRALFTAMGVTVAWTISAYMYLAYMPTYMTKVIGLEFGTALTINLVTVAAYLPAIPTAAWLSDRVGRRPMLIAGCVATFALTYPALQMMRTGSIPLIVVANLALLLSFATFAGVAPAALSELFPTKVRYTAVAVSYAVTVAALGGTAPFVSTLLIDLTGTPVAPSFYMMVGAAVTLAVLLTVYRDRAHQPLPDEDAVTAG